MRRLVLLVIGFIATATSLGGGAWWLLSPDASRTSAWMADGQPPIRFKFDAIPVVEALLYQPLSVDAAERANEKLPFSLEPIEAASPLVLASSELVPAGRKSAIDCLTAAVYYEAGNEGLTGKQGVAQVVLNRVRHPAFPNSVCGVVYQGSERRTGCQFTFTCDGSLARVPTRHKWDDARRIATSALAGRVEPEVGMATHYHADYVVPYWAPSLSKIAKLGAHIFYRWPGNWGRRPAFNQRVVLDIEGDLNVATEALVDSGEIGDLPLDVLAGPAVPEMTKLKADSVPLPIEPSTSRVRVPDLQPGALRADRNRGSLKVDDAAGESGDE